MASIIKLKDGTGNIIEVPALIGPRGHEGPPGPSGIYIGPGDMPDGYNLQIDPEGALNELPTPTPSDVGKVLSVDENGKYIIENAIPEGVILYTPQTLTEEQKAQARENIGAGDSSIPASNVTKGTFAGKVNMNTTAAANLEAPQMRDVVILNTDPGENTEVEYPIGTVIYVV